MRPRDAIYATVKRRIVLNELRPGVVLTELGLAADLDCSQGPVREALMRLQEDGLVLRNGHRGTVVTPLNPEEAEEILALRRRIEVRAAPKAAQRINARALERVAQLNASMAEAAQAGDEYSLIELDTAFHLEIFRLAELRAMEQILVRCILHSHRQKLWEPRHRRPLVETAARHGALYDLLAARDGKGLAAALGEHIDTIVEVQAERAAS
ncbi:MAG: GntR family transcriptional regulator [Devosia sp.]|nr:GntR family transcriptional regulator [Devosia sp.]